VSNRHDFNPVVSQLSNTCNELNCLRSMVSSYSNICVNIHSHNIHVRLTLLNHFGVNIVYEHWPNNREFITRTAEFWNRWIWMSCYYNRIQRKL